MGKLPAKVYKKNKKADLNLKLPWPKITITINKIGNTMVISFILLIIMLKFLYFNASCLNFYKAAADGVSVLVLQKILPLFIPFWIIRIWFSPSTLACLTVQTLCSSVSFVAWSNKLLPTPTQTWVGHKQGRLEGSGASTGSKMSFFYLLKKLLYLAFCSCLA